MPIRLNHITLAVNNITRSFDFYRNILGLEPLCRWDKGAYFLIGDFWFCLNVDKNVQPESSYTHYAFTATQENFFHLRERLLNSGVQVFQENSSEGDSFYFLDPDGHKLEIHVGDWRSRIATKKIAQGEWRNVECFV
ncbi:MAG: glutathione transferase [Gammaproteobacteria bacterium GWE2_37_16]|nr:MAG: glutathione transferase [Gammaproteobacteria bacterium GWE2_37_16]